DGRLLAVTWAYDERAGRSRPTMFTLSADGRTFAPPTPNGLMGETAKLLALPDNQVLCLYRHQQKPGLWACIARIEGDQWRTLHDTPLWQGQTSHMSGEQAGSDELSGLKFGYPSMVRRP